MKKVQKVQKVQKVLYTREGNFCYYDENADGAVLDGIGFYTEKLFVLRYDYLRNVYMNISPYYSKNGIYNVFVEHHEMDIINI